MNLGQASLLLILALLIIGGYFGFIYYFQNYTNNPEPIDAPLTEINQQLCESAGGSWNECGSKCGIVNEGNPDNVACPTICDPICECGTLDELQCPSGFRCITSGYVEDSIGYCEQS